MNIENKEEKLVSGYFERIGFTSKKLDQSNTKKMPDYLLEKGELRFVVEVKNIDEQQDISNAIPVQKRILSILKDLKLEYSLRVSIRNQIFLHEINKSELVNLIRRELSQSSLDTGYVFSYRSKVDFKVNGRMTDNQIGHNGGYYSPNELSYPDSIRKDINNAVKKYKSYGMALPYVLIEFPGESLFSKVGLLKAMLGEWKNGSRVNSELQPDKNTSISAVAVYIDSHFEIYHNPYRSIALSYEVFNQNANMQYYVDSKTGEFVSK